MASSSSPQVSSPSEDDDRGHDRSEDEAFSSPTSSTSSTEEAENGITTAQEVDTTSCHLSVPRQQPLVVVTNSSGSNSIVVPIAIHPSCASIQQLPPLMAPVPTRPVPLPPTLLESFCSNVADQTSYWPTQTMGSCAYESAPSIDKWMRPEHQSYTMLQPLAQSSYYSPVPPTTSFGSMVVSSLISTPTDPFGGTASHILHQSAQSNVGDTGSELRSRKSAHQLRRPVPLGLGSHEQSLPSVTSEFTASSGSTILSPTLLPLLSATAGVSGPTSPTYRRRNERERERVRCVNDGYARLRELIPSLRSRQKRVSKVETLRAASRYIVTLREALYQTAANGGGTNR